VEAIVPNIERHLCTEQIAYVGDDTQVGTDAKGV
jgi:hypothetical protein